MWTYAVGDDPVDIMALDDGFDERLTWDLDASERLKDFHRRAMEGTAWYVAWNMGFDRHMWNCPESDFPEMRIDMALDAMVQGASSGLPGKLEHAGRACGFGGKLAAGSNLIKLFAPADGETPQGRPDLWDEYKHYGIKDTELLRDVFFATRQLPREEWQDYWVSERVNSRGFAVDVGFARRAAAVAAANVERINQALVRATNGQITRVTQIARLTDWTYDRLESAEARDIMVKSWDLDDEDDVKPAKLALDKPRIEALLAYFDSLDELSYLDEVTKEVLDHRLYGGSASPAKFGKIVRMQHDGNLRNQYTFNGAPQTGRYSSRGVQIHNLMRKSLGAKEAEVMELINDLEI
jgi:DNA polymerase